MRAWYVEQNHTSGRMLKPCLVPSVATNIRTRRRALVPQHDTNHLAAVNGTLDAWLQPGPLVLCNPWSAWLLDHGRSGRFGLPIVWVGHSSLLHQHLHARGKQPESLRLDQLDLVPNPNQPLVLVPTSVPEQPRVSHGKLYCARRGPLRSSHHVARDVFVQPAPVLLATARPGDGRLGVLGNWALEPNHVPEHDGRRGLLVPDCLCLPRRRPHGQRGYQLVWATRYTAARARRHDRKECRPAPVVRVPGVAQPWVERQVRDESGDPEGASGVVHLLWGSQPGNRVSTELPQPRQGARGHL